MKPDFQAASKRTSSWRRVEMEKEDLDSLLIDREQTRFSAIFHRSCETHCSNLVTFFVILWLQFGRRNLLSFMRDTPNMVPGETTSLVPSQVRMSEISHFKKPKHSVAQVVLNCFVGDNMVLFTFLSCHFLDSCKLWVQVSLLDT